MKKVNNKWGILTAVIGGVVAVGGLIKAFAGHDVDDEDEVVEDYYEEETDTEDEPAGDTSDEAE